MSSSSKERGNKSALQGKFFVAGLTVCCVVFCSVVSLRLLTAEIGPARQTAAHFGPLVEIAPTTRADEERCADCHEQAERFSETGHARTMSAASDENNLALLQKMATSEIGRRESVSVVQNSSGIQIRTEQNGQHFSTGVDWCLGSGTHARTFVGTLPDSFNATDLIELRWTWYHATGDFDVTPGHAEERGPGRIGSLGLLFDGPRAVRCYSCHASHLVVSDGRIDESAVVPGVSCQRCHGPRAKHVASDGAWEDPAWSRPDRQQEMALCSECHRSIAEMDADAIRPDNPDIVRFQPVGLSQSACYLKSELRCTTCHDPHTPLADQNLSGKWQCVQCHDPQQPAHTVCGKGMTDDCVKCHMPKVVTEIPVQFTDHWIRVPDGSESSE